MSDYPIFYTFATNLMTYKGHLFEYHKTVGQAVSSLEMETTTFVPTNCEIDPLPDNWKKKLYNPTKWRSKPLLAKLFPLLINSSPLYKLTRSLHHILSESIEPTRPKIFFFETFNTFYLIALYFALALHPKLKRSIQLALLYRYEPKLMHFKGKKDRKWLKRLEKLLKKPLILLTDTDLLNELLSTYFNKTFYTLPIPHTENFPIRLQPTDTNHLTLWWPGAPRRPKGLDSICNLAKRPKPNFPVTLIVAEESKITSDTLKIEYTSSSMAREDYIDLFMKSDFILLPYDPVVYGASSSGIFVEAVFSGCYPIVTPHTWLASELLKFDLHELILDFRRKDFFEYINSLKQNEKVRKKFHALESDYHQTHNLSHFTYCLDNAIQACRSE